MNTHSEYLKYITRRTFLGQTGVGVGALALAAMLEKEAIGAEDRAPQNPLAPRKPPLAAKAKSVIFLHMAGAPSQLDLFDYKPTLQKLSGKPCPDTFLKGKRFAFIRGVPNLLGTPFKFQQHGKSGAWLSNLWTYLPEVVDEIAFIKSVKTDQFNHAPAQLYLQTGDSQFGKASMGSWATYGLGSENQNLPGFIVLASGGKTVDAGKSIWGSGFLPGVYQGVQCRTTGEPVLYLSNPRGLDSRGRRETLDTLQQLNKLTAESVGDPETITRIAQYELAFRMQTAVPEAMDISKETKQTLELYGAKPGYVSDTEGADDPRTLYKGTDPSFANNCLLARRLVERGVRFVQLYDWGWDHHGISPGEDITHTLPIKVQQIDRAITGLIKDLKQRGLLDSTLIIWASEFGRTPMQQNSPNQPYIGRDHHPFGYTIFMVGGGIQGGQTFGETDEIGYYAVKDEFDIRDLQATTLRLLGLDPWKLTYFANGLNHRLIGVEGKAKIHQQLLKS